MRKLSTLILIAAILPLALAPSSLRAQPRPQSETEPGTLAPTIRTLVEAPYLKPQEAQALRLQHGISTPEDLAIPLLRAQASLTRGNLSDASLSNPDLPLLMQADIQAQRANHAQVLKLLEPAPNDLQHNALRVQSHLAMGKLDQALAASSLALTTLRTNPQSLTTTDDILASVHIANLIIRAKGSTQADTDFQALMALLGTARTIDPTDYRVPLAEANLLLDKDNYAQARKAALEAISLNPAAAHAWSLLGHMSVSSFDFETATSVATKLDALFELLPLAADGNDPQTPSSPVASPLGATLRVRIALRQDDPDSALAALEAIKPIAGQTALYLEYLTALRAAQYDQAAMDQASQAFSAISPGSADALFRAGQVLSDLRQYERAVGTLHRASLIEPNWPQPLVELGLVLVQAGLDDGPDGARAVLSQATALDPFNVRADNSLKLLKSFDAFKTIAVANGKIIIRHKPGLDARVAKEMVPVLQEIHARITATDPASLKHEPARPTMIELMPDHASFAVRIAGMPRIHTIAASTGPVIAMESPRDGKGHSGTYDWPRVIAHEYVHTVGLSRTGNRMPHWFTEAQAQYLERRPRDWSTVQLLHRILEDEELFDFEQINVAFTRPKKPTDRSQAYAQGHWMYEYLVKTFGTEAPLALMDEFAKGVREPQAFANVLKISRENFFDDFQAWARNELRQWGMIAPEGQESARAILTRAAQKLLPEGSTQEPDPSGLTLAQLDEVAKTVPDHAEIQGVVLTQLASQADADFEALAPRLEAYAKLRPVDPMPHKALARHYLASGQVDKAIEHLKWLDIREDRQSVFASQIAAAYAQLGDFNSAWPFAVRATHIAPYQGDHRELAAAIAIQRRDLASARQHLEFLAELEPTQNQHRRRLDALAELEKSAGNKSSSSGAGESDGREVGEGSR